MQDIQVNFQYSGKEKKAHHNVNMQDIQVNFQYSGKEKKAHHNHAS